MRGLAAEGAAGAAAHATAPELLRRGWRLHIPLEERGGGRRQRRGRGRSGGAKRGITAPQGRLFLRSWRYLPMINGNKGDPGRFLWPIGQRLFLSAELKFKRRLEVDRNEAPEKTFFRI
eukprot:scaffold913_cov233-Pinguiococcus_pyrenoidosus.AAC.12